MDSKIQLLFRENIQEELNKIRNNGGKVYSISRVNNYDTCPRQYYHTYVNKIPQKAGIYGILGTACHSDLENLYEGKTETLEPSTFNDEWLKSQLFGIKFPSEKIRDNYEKDIKTFYNTYSKMDGEFISELGFILKLDDIHFLTGFIDLIQVLEGNKINIFDFKTSAMFKGEKIIHSGRQLCVYQMAMEQLYGLETVINGWQMLKYVEVRVGNNKPKVVEARAWVDKSSTQIKKLLLSSGVNPIMVDMILAQCIATNSIDTLPQEIKDMINIQTYFLPYEVTDDVKNETINYILTTINEIESKDITNIEDWQPKTDKFFCTNLCGFGNNGCYILK